MGLSLTNLKCDYLINPIGIDGCTPSFGWQLLSDAKNVLQTAYQVIVKKGIEVVWNTGKQKSEQSAFLRYEGKALVSRTGYVWEVTVWDNQGNTASASGEFETAILSVEEWEAKWIEPVQTPAFHEPSQSTMESETSAVEEIKMQPPQMVRKEFTLSRPIQSARVYATAHGVYYMELNGSRVGDIQLAPGNTAYDKYLEYQVYDVTNQLRVGNNAVGMVIGDGWYVGKVGICGQSCQYGDTLAALFQIEVTYEDGTREMVVSDGQCTSSTGHILYADIFVGEAQDFTKKKEGFSRAGFSEEGWKPVTIKDYSYQNLYAPYGEPVRICETLKPVKIWKSPQGDVILDVGQVLCGRVRMRARGERGTKIVLEHTETIDKEGNYQYNIIGKFVLQQDTCILNGDGEEVFEPEFTFHGFRYIRISGYPGKPTIEDFDILVLHSDMKQTGTFQCSDERLNQLQHNIFWSQKSNMLSIPTDCPQREKAGWTGDVQIFAPTACFNMDMIAFFKRWLRNVEKEQKEDGQIPNIVPYLLAYNPNGVMPSNTHCSSGWGDVAVILPWKMYEAYGDRSVLSEYYPMMKKWVEYIRYTAETEVPKEKEGKLTEEEMEIQKYLWNTNFHFGDWLTPSVSFDFETGDVDMMQSAFRTMDIVPTTFYAYSTELIAKIARELGKKEDAEYYQELNRKVRYAFRKEYVNEHGLIKTELQGVYVLALQMNLIPQNRRENAVNKLVSMIQENGNKLDTGFLSVPFLLDVLCNAGKSDVAYDLLFQDGCPSWLYEVKMGATTMWEAWQAVLPDGTNTSVSYNHYAFGCVGDWMYRTIGGLNQLLPGYKKILIAPQLDERLTSASISYDSSYGLIVARWKRDGKKMIVDVTIPANTTARIKLPGGDTIETGSGSYVYEYKMG